ncbi:type I DNA topoisomerase [Deinococcus sp. QL22]|uniref:type I DNA topoisomerase n=1 Tax=Deinococcus sp. QL22 TaxID=2939437 RepID=UPI002017FC6B|nr:type I DNA topoisomerase [Deinococcus sp. QL22]UQN09620.1 type I DNA topoisomerase [Deinococcus sp. QL22]
MSTLVIVESPAKAKKIASLLGAGYVVKASLGHVRDLPASKAELPAKYRNEPWANLGVNPETFAPVYVVPSKKAATVRDLKAAAARADRILFASDADREGEAISWHLSRLLGVKDPQRMTFTEITKAALTRAVAQPRPLDLQLVAAQEARRVIDRLVGWEVSPLLWNSVGRGLSAGRVQSAALMLLAARELARLRFVPAAYWLIRADAQTAPPFAATVTAVKSREFPEGKALAKASDFTPDGALKPGADVLQLSAEQAAALAAHLDGRTATVTDIEQSEVRVRPPPPFITSTLQQAAGRVGLGAKAAMDTAQRLYEGGHITYHRTDSPALSDEALDAARAEAVRLFGKDAVPDRPRQYATRSANAQEAHEAIRPAGHGPWRTPDSGGPNSAGLSGQDAALYRLIYQRTVASQMHDALYDKTGVTLHCGAATLAASGRVLTQAGFTALTGADTGGEDAADPALPPLTLGQTFPLKARKPEEKKTSAPTRYSEATLVKAMEQAGIGRPSTYAQTVNTLHLRGYAVGVGKHLAVTATGLLVVAYLSRHLPDVLERTFTATMEAGLDEIAGGQITRVAYLTRFWTNGLAPAVQGARREAPVLALPHLPGASLIAGLQGPRLRLALPDSAPKEVPWPPNALPGEITPDDLPALLDGTFRGGTSQGVTGAGQSKQAEFGSAGTAAQPQKRARRASKGAASPRGASTARRTSKTAKAGASAAQTNAAKTKISTAATAKANTAKAATGKSTSRSSSAEAAAVKRRDKK